MKYLLSNDDILPIWTEADSRGLKYYMIVKRKTLVNPQWEVYEENYELYELEEQEANQLLEEDSKEAIISKFFQTLIKENEEITEIKIYHEDKLMKEFGERIRVLIFEPFQPSYIKEIENTRTAIREIIGGYPEYVNIGRPDLVLICHEEGMLLNLPKDRGIYGTFIVAGLLDGECVSLTDEQIEDVRSVFEKRENYQSKNVYLTRYFQNNPVPRKMFHFEINGRSYYIDSESVIEFLLSQEDEDILQMIEMEIKDIEKSGKDIYLYLERIAYQMAKQQDNRFK